MAPLPPMSLIISRGKDPAALNISLCTSSSTFHFMQKQNKTKKKQIKSGSHRRTELKREKQVKDDSSPLSGCETDVFFKL